MRVKEFLKLLKDTIKNDNNKYFENKLILIASEPILGEIYPYDIRNISYVNTKVYENAYILGDCSRIIIGEDKGIILIGEKIIRHTFQNSVYVNELITILEGFKQHKEIYIKMDNSREYDWNCYISKIIEYKNGYLIEP